MELLAGLAVSRCIAVGEYRPPQDAGRSRPSFRSARPMVRDAASHQTEKPMTYETETRSIFVTGLKNAHAMENQALSIMKPQLSRIENYPEVAAKLDQHIRETEGQITRIDGL